jgi:putative spermidine/putrescine transport system ATP-binding protein
MSFLELTGIQKRFGDVAAVEDFNLSAVRGEFVSFLGPSGCGKTTTLRMIAGFERPTDGNIVIDGVDVTNRPPNRRNVGMVFQSYALFPNMNVADNIGFGLKVRKRPRTQIAKRVDELLNLIHLEGRGGRYPYQLSGGQQQRVALARALAIEPQVLLLDEPLSALDAKIRLILRKEIRAIQRQLGITTVYVTHDQEEALSLSDRVVVMSEGRIEQIGTPFEIYNFPSTAFVASFVGTLNLVAAGVVDAGAGRLSLEGQEIRTTKAVTDAGSDGRVTLAVRPEGISLGDGPDGANRLRGRIEDINFLGSIVRLRLGLGNGNGAGSIAGVGPLGTGTTIALDTFNEPHLRLPAVGDLVTVWFPQEACFVLGSAREGAAAVAEVNAEV